MYNALGVRKKVKVKLYLFICEILSIQSEIIVWRVIIKLIYRQC